MEEKLARMRQLVEELTKAGQAYYAENREIMSNYAYDTLYDELLGLEKETGVILSESPTQKVGYGEEIAKFLPKERHETPMLSLDKTKEREDLREWLGEKKGLLSWKLDGITIVLTYQNGILQKAVTRGNGEEGEVITANARTFVNLPLHIAYEGTLVLRGEAVITYSDFEKINEEIDAEMQYKNPRNLCSGSVRQLDSRVTAQRKVRFLAHALVKADGVDFKNSRKVQFEWLKQQGIEVVEYKEVTGDTILDAVDEFAEKVEQYEIPSDGLVLLYDDIAYGESLGRTAKFPRNAIAFKWADEIRETSLRMIEWSASRTGLINPVAVFDPIELEGTTVSRASVHNISVLESFELGEGDKITVYKANMIIPQIAENLTRSNSIQIPSVCPVCKGKTEIRQVGDVKSLYCTNPECQAKKIKSFALFVSRDAMNIDGLSEMTLEKFIAEGLIHEFADIFELPKHKDEIVKMEGLGEKSFEKLKEALQKSSHTTLVRFIYSLGIPGIGLAGAKLLVHYFKKDLQAMRTASVDQLTEIEGIGPVLAKSWVEYWNDEENMKKADRVLSMLTFEEEPTEESDQMMEGQVIVITGSLTHFANRKELQTWIEDKGGKVTGSVTSKTTCLINNDTASASSKNKKAKELGIPILSEEEFLKKWNSDR